MKRLTPLLLVAVLLLAGCAATLTGKQHVEMIQGKPYTYVAIHNGGAILDHTLIMSLFDPDGKHVMSQTINNNGILETLGGTALQTMVPAWNAFQAYTK
ncbi:MAG: hypothetical protein ACLQVJ_17070 [Syntrophobacteraceae bacterium]